MISEIKTYRNEKGIEIHEEIPINGNSDEKFYVAIVNILVNIGEFTESQPIHARFKAPNIEQAFINAEPALQKAIEEFRYNAEQNMKKVNDDRPRIILPEDC